MDDPEAEWVRSITEAIRSAQARNLAFSYILTEIIVDLARTSGDPDRYLAAMFERISARMDQDPIEKDAHPVKGEMREVISHLF